MPEHDPEQDLGPKLTSAFRDHAGSADGLQTSGLAQEARRRVRKRRKTLNTAAAAVAVVAVIGGGWSLAQRGSESPTASSNDSKSGVSEGAASGKSTIQGLAPSAPGPAATAACPSDAAILQAGGHNAVPAGTGLDLNTPVQGMQACRYQLATGALLGQQSFTAEVAQQVVDAIKVLPERNPALPVFKCTPQAAIPSEAIVLRFTTAAGIREIWVEYDGCDSAGFFTGTHTYGLYAAPLKLFLVGTVRPTGGTFLNALKGW